MVSSSPNWISLKPISIYVELDEGSQQFVVIKMYKGLFKYTCLSFGIVTAPAIFQQTMDTVLQGLSGVACYLDDIIVKGKNKPEHKFNLEQALNRIQENEIQVRKDKCSFLQDSVEYLGHILDKNGIQMSPQKVKAIVKMPQPKYQRELRTFLALVNHYGKFIPKLSELCT